MMKWLKRAVLGLGLTIVVLFIALDTWGALTLGTLTPDPGAARDASANRVVLVAGATGSVGDGLLKAAMEDPSVERILVITRRSSPRIDELPNGTLIDNADALAYARLYREANAL